MNEKLILHIIGIIGIAGLLGHSLKLYLVYLVAFLSGNEVTVAVNNYGEAGIEFFFFPVTIVLGLIGFYHYFRMMPKRKKATK